MQLAELDHHILGPQLQAGRTAGMPPVAVLALDQLQRGDRGADLFQHGGQIGLQGEQGVLSNPGPVAGGVRGDQACDDGALIRRPVAQIDGADLEQGGVGEAARGVPRRRLDQVRQGGRPHAVQIGRNRVLQHQPFVPAAEQGGGRLFGEGPGDGLGIAKSGKRPARRADAGLAGAQHPAGGAGDLGQGRVGQAVEALDPRHLFHQIRPALDVAPPRGGGDDPGFGLTGRGGLNQEAELAQDGPDPIRRQIHAAEPLHIGGVEGEGRRPSRGFADEDDLGRFAAAQVQDQAGGQLQPRRDRDRIDAAREPILGVGMDAERAARLGDDQRVEPGAFQEDVGGVVVAAGAFAAHDPAQADGALAPGVGDDAVGGGDRIGLAVQGDQMLSLARRGRNLTGAHHDLGPRQLGQVIDVQRPGAVVGDQIGDIDQAVDRAQADGGQAFLQPGGRRAVLDAPDHPTGEDRAHLGRVQPHADRRREAPAHHGDVEMLQLADAGGGQIARDPRHAQPVGPVRRDLEVDDGLGAEQAGDRGSHRDLRRQFLDAVAFVGQLKLGGRAQHAVGHHAAHRLLDQGDAKTRHIGADGGVDGGQARPRVRGAADDLLDPVHRLDLTDLQPVGVGVAFGRQDLGHGEGRQLGGGVEHLLDLQPGHGHGLGDLMDVGLGFEVILEPGKGELHAGTPPRTC